MAGARPHRAEPGAQSARPTKGGAMRIRIALTTAVAVIVVAVPAVLMSLLSSDPAWAQATRHEAVGSHQGADAHHAVRINDTLMSYSQARKVAQMVRTPMQSRRPNRPPSTRTCLHSRPSRPRSTPSRRHGCRPPSAKRAARTTRMPDTSGSSSGTASTAIRPPAARPLSVQLAWEARTAGTARRTRRVPQLLIERPSSEMPCRYPASNMAVTCAMSK